MFKGSYVALVTPFKNGKLDEARLKWLVDYQIDHETDGLVPCGTTGESPTLSHAEHKRVIELVIRQSRGRVPVLAGAGSNSTAETIELTRFAERAGAAGALLVTPYYNKPTQAGLYAHYRAVSRASHLPIMLYNIPGRSVVSVNVETVVRLAHDCRTIIGIKEASGSMEYTSDLLSRVDVSRFLVLSGDDSLTLPLMSLGAKGVISVAANILPRSVAQMCRAWTIGNVDQALALHRQMFPLMRALFLETNPVPVKAAMAALRLCREDLRLPLVPMSREPRQKLLAALRSCALLKDNRP